LADVEQRFVTEAPFAKERATVMTALRLYADRVWGLIPSARLWVNGGFVTHKRWAAPKDADVAVIVETAELGRASSRPAQSLWTLQGVTVQEPHIDLAKRIQPFGGLIDGFLAPALPATMSLWDSTWSSVTDESKNRVEGKVKGYVEVVNES
jgi:hypothetical protein